jgi:hypothetical protein
MALHIWVNIFGRTLMTKLHEILRKNGLKESWGTELSMYWNITVPDINNAFSFFEESRGDIPHYLYILININIIVTKKERKKEIKKIKKITLGF